MFAKWIHPNKIIPFEGDILRHKGSITVYPTKEELIRAGYYPVIVAEGQNVSTEGNIFLVKNKQIHILSQGDS